MQVVMLILVGIALAGIVGLFIVSLTAARPANLGVRDGRLAETPDSPNCVSTQTDNRSHWMAPLTFTGPADEAREILRQIVLAMPRTTMVEETEDYLYVEFRSPVFRFVDDVEFLIQPDTQRIHFRSASRVGHSDLGVNRARMESIRERFNRRLQSQPQSSPSAPARDPLRSP